MGNKAEEFTFINITKLWRNLVERFGKMYTCTFCGKEYSPKGYSTEKYTKQRFCSRNCYNEWLKIHAKDRLPKDVSGKNNPRYIEGIERTKICEYCHKSFIVKNAYIAKRENKRFCSIKCRREWFKNVWSQRDEWKEDRRQWGLESAKTVYKTSNSHPQLICNEILNRNKIKYENEKVFEYYSIDSYLVDVNLAIEVMGTYFHCDVRKYDRPKYKLQEDRIIRDKAKQSYMKNIRNISILYLWEDELENNAELCEKLILLYIKNNGILEDYHSCNYSLDDNNKLVLNKNIIVQFFEMGTPT